MYAMIKIKIRWNRRIEPEQNQNNPREKNRFISMKKNISMYILYL